MKNGNFFIAEEETTQPNLPKQVSWPLRRSIPIDQKRNIRKAQTVPITDKQTTPPIKANEKWKRKII
jgi:hypothetical protein